MKKIEYTGEIRELKYNNYHFMIDKTKMEYTDSIFHIPYFHLFCEEIKSKKVMDGFSFVKISYFDQDDYYFELDTIDINKEMFDKMITFLSSN